MFEFERKLKIQRETERILSATDWIQKEVELDNKKVQKNMHKSHVMLMSLNFVVIFLSHHKNRNNLVQIDIIIGQTYLLMK